MFDNKNRFMIQNYQKQKTFSSFLPGIAGMKGIPVWSFYVNRGQGIASFGVGDKQHPIMEFFPAHTSYQMVRKNGFRTFVKVNGNYAESFSSYDNETNMYIGINELELAETDRKNGIQTEVLYYILPESPVGALVRRLKIRNTNTYPVTVEVADGMPALIPYGVTLRDMKEVAQTIQAWMQTEHIEDRLPFYRLRASSADTAEVSQIEEGNFYAAFNEEGSLLPVIADPQLLFEYDTSFERAVGFEKEGIDDLLKKDQITACQVPCAFCCTRDTLPAGGELVIYSMAGHAPGYKQAAAFAEQKPDSSFFEDKYSTARSLAEKITDNISVKTADRTFDIYCRQTYLDNMLRGGYPVLCGEKSVLYIYSRKHGDLERDYNSFSMSPEYCSQGNGNYRDVNQNRRSDLIFSPFVKDYNIRKFYDLIQMDGCNPLVLLPSKFQLNDFSVLDDTENEERNTELRNLLKRPYTPGELLMALKTEEGRLFGKILDASTEIENAELDDGYWTDHWTYNLDLVESYLTVYPEKREELLFDSRNYLYYSSCADVLPRKDRYVQTEEGVRQFEFIRRKENQAGGSWVRTEYGKGKIYRSVLMTKLVLLAAVKFASLDIKGKGLEMEAGKPGWYDALNGLPSLFGSSMCDAYELVRMTVFIRENLSEYKRDTELPEELYGLLERENEILQCFFRGTYTKSMVWNQLNLAKESYRDSVTDGISGKMMSVSPKELTEILELFLRYQKDGIQKAVTENGGIPPAYCSYHMDSFSETDGIITFHGMTERRMPDFLEGPLRYLKLPISMEEKQTIYRKVKNSDLYDGKLKMYKINAPLTDQPQEIGRARAFARGWLENESIWLHMEYKYLLEILKSGMYKEFFKDMDTALIPFMNYDVYGRSLTENSSFIASSVNENGKIHGRGFVARLSGSTAEFLDMWHRMFFGEKLLRNTEQGRSFVFEPAIPERLIPDDGVVSVRLFGHTDIVYHIRGKGDLIPGHYIVKDYKATYGETCRNGRTVLLNQLDDEVFESVRRGDIVKIEMEIVPR